MALMRITSQNIQILHSTLPRLLFELLSPNLTLSQTVQLERMQAKALKAIYGYEPSDRELVEKSGLQTLRARREDREIAFARKGIGFLLNLKGGLPGQGRGTWRNLLDVVDVTIPRFSACVGDSIGKSDRARLGKEGQLRGLQTASASLGPRFALGRGAWLGLRIVSGCSLYSCAYTKGSWGFYTEPLTVELVP